MRQDREASDSSKCRYRRNLEGTPDNLLASGSGPLLNRAINYLTKATGNGPPAIADRRGPTDRKRATLDKGNAVPSLFVDNGAPHRARHRRDFMLVVQVGGLLATAWLIWSISLLPRLDREPMADVVAQALAYTLLACLASALIALSLYLLIARSFSDEAIRMGLRTSGTAVWFGAATILLAELSPATLPAALVLVISTTRLLYSQWRLVHRVHGSTVSAPIQHPFFDPPPAPRLRELIPALAASLAIEAGVLLFPANYPLLAAALLCLSVAMVTFCALRAGAIRTATANSLPRSILGFFLTLILAAGLTVGGLAGGLRSGSQWNSPLQRRPGPFDSARALLKNFSRRMARAGRRTLSPASISHPRGPSRSPTTAFLASFYCRRQSRSSR